MLLEGLLSVTEAEAMGLDKGWHAFAWRCCGEGCFLLLTWLLVSVELMRELCLVAWKIMV